MSYAISFTIDHRIAMSDAKMLASRIWDETDLHVTTSGGWFTRTTDCFWTTDSGDLSEDFDARFVPRPGVADQVLSVIQCLLTLSSSVVFRAAWMGESVSSQLVLGLDEFTKLIDSGQLRDRVAYQVCSSTVLSALDSPS